MPPGQPRHWRKTIPKVLADTTKGNTCRDKADPAIWPIPLTSTSLGVVIGQVMTKAQLKTV